MGFFPLGWHGYIPSAVPPPDVEQEPGSYVAVLPEPSTAHFSELALTRSRPRSKEQLGKPSGPHYRHYYNYFLYLASWIEAAGACWSRPGTPVAALWPTLSWLSHSQAYFGSRLFVWASNRRALVAMAMWVSSTSVWLCVWPLQQGTRSICWLVKLSCLHHY